METDREATSSFALVLNDPIAKPLLGVLIMPLEGPAKSSYGYPIAIICRRASQTIFNATNCTSNNHRNLVQSYHCWVQNAVCSQLHISTSTAVPPLLFVIDKIVSCALLCSLRSGGGLGERTGFATTVRHAIAVDQHNPAPPHGD